MRIKNQFLISIVTFSIILIIIGATIALTQQQITELNNQRTLAEEIQTGATDLNYISNNYFLYQDNSSISLWQTKFSTLSQKLSQLNSTNLQQQTLVDTVSRDLENLNSVFAGVTSFLVNAPRNVSIRVLPSFQTQWNRMAVQIQSLAFDSQQLSQSISDQTNQANMTNIILTVAFLGLFGTYFITSYLITYRRTLKSISKLQDEIGVIGSGNLDYIIDANKKDEIADISKSLNQMAINLKTVTASKTELEQAQASLRESEQRWATTLASIGDAVITTDTTGKIVFMNRVAEELTGWSLSSASLKPVKEVFNIINEQTRLEVENPITRVLKEGLIVGLANHTILLRRDGSEVPIDDSGAPIKDKDGKITGVVLIFRNIRERKKMEEETQRLLGSVQQERDRLSSLLNSINDEVWFADTEKKFTLANPSAVKEFKLDSTEISVDVENLAATSKVYRPDGSLRPIEEAPPLRALKGENVKNQEEVVRTPVGGELRHRQVSSAPVRDREGNIIGSVSVVRDITELKILQNRLQKYTEDLEKIVEERTKQLKDAERLAAIGATAGMVGHDIRNPLQAITGDVYLLKTELASMPESEDKESAKESLDGIEKNIDYINKIVQDLQDFARPLKPNAEETDLKLIIDELLKKNGLPENIKVNVKVETNAKKVVADSLYINRIMSNLLNNAVQAMPKGGKLTIHVYKEANDSIITVKDNGVGIPESVKSKLFTPMFTTKSKGQGFGLPVVKRMTEALNGTVMFESQEGKGTTFTIRLPQKK
jgi:PAS domain S-box-containing protein